MDLRKIVRERMEELGMTVAKLAAAADVKASSVYEFLRDPKTMKGYTDGKTRHGTMNSDSLASVLDALDLTVTPKAVKKAKK